MPNSKIIGSGVYLPPFSVSNQTIADFFPKPPTSAWTPEWVEKRIGIRERRSSFNFSTGRMLPDHYDSDNAYRAAVNAIQNAGIDRLEVDRILYATSTPDELIPDPACVLHKRLGLHEREDVPALGATAVGCGGFLYLLDVADSEIRSGKYRTVLVVGSVVTAPYLEAAHLMSIPEERERHLAVNLINAYLFGEGAGALVLRATDDKTSGILCSVTGADGRDNPVIFEAGGSRRPATHETVREALHRFKVDVRLVKTHGPDLFMRALSMIFRRSGLRSSDIDYFIFHQINYRLLQKITHDLKIPREKVAVHVDRYGNLNTATLPIAFHEARVDGKIKDGDLILFAAIGAGWQYGAMIVRM